MCWKGVDILILLISWSLNAVAWVVINNSRHSLSVQPRLLLCSTCSRPLCIAGIWTCPSARVIVRVVVRMCECVRFFVPSYCQRADSACFTCSNVIVRRSEGPLLLCLDIVLLCIWVSFVCARVCTHVHVSSCLREVTAVTLTSRKVKHLLFTLQTHRTYCVIVLIFVVHLLTGSRCRKHFMVNREKGEATAKPAQTFYGRSPVLKFLLPLLRVWEPIMLHADPQLVSPQIESMWI